MFRKIFYLILIFLTFVYPADITAVTIQGSKGLIESRAFTFQNITFVPLTSFAKAYGMQEIWNPKTKMVHLQGNQTKFSFRVGSPYFSMNGKIGQMPSEARLVNGRLLIPFQFGTQTFSKLSINEPLAIAQPSQKPPTNVLSRSTFTVLLDPGHGGYDVGAKGRRGIHEKDINLDVARKVRDKLQAQGIRVLMTRSVDNFISLWGRVGLARQYKPDIFVSIHTNAARNRTVNGIELFYYANANVKENGTSCVRNKTKSYQLARSIQSKMITQVRSRSRGVKGARFFVLRNATTPAILVEVGFITHGSEEKNLAQKNYRDTLAQAIADGIISFKAKS